MTFIAISPSSPSLLPQATALAAKLGLPITQPQNPKSITDYTAILIISENGISLQECGEKASGAISVDFVSGAAAHRRKFGGGKGQSIAKAIGLQSLKNPYVIDATAGLGRDGFVLASLGCRVHMIERSPIVFTLLEDGIARALENEEIRHIVKNMSVTNENGLQWLTNTKESPDVIYLDPMFPERGKTALVKKEMRIFKQIVGTDTDAGLLLEPALAKAKYRVVVKRPRLAPTINEIAPTFQLEGKSNRFDVYVKVGVRNFGK
jgi:16S rRNA (guanine1516-N2)-methyltransferase